LYVRESLFFCSRFAHKTIIRIAESSELILPRSLFILEMKKSVIIDYTRDHHYFNFFSQCRILITIRNEIGLIANLIKQYIGS